MMSPMSRLSRIFSVVLCVMMTTVSIITLGKTTMMDTPMFVGFFPMLTLRPMGFAFLSL